MRTMPALFLTILLAVGSAPGDGPVDPAVSQLKLRPRAVVTSSTVTFGDVLDFSAADERLTVALAGQALREPVAGRSLDVTHARIVEQMRQLGVNMARVLVSGAARCEVSLEPPAPFAGERSPGAMPPEGEAPLLREAAGDGSLAGRIRTFVENECAALGGRVEIEFERASDDLLKLTSPPWQFSVRSGDRERLGLREFVVTIRRDGQTQRTVRLTGRVRLVRSVLVARQPLNRGSYVRPDDLALETRFFERDGEMGVDRPQALVGCQVGRFVPAGQMVLRADVKPADMVTRSQRVSVLHAAGGVRANLSGVALDAGTWGDTVRVRIGDARHERQIVRGVVCDFGVVRLVEN